MRATKIPDHVAEAMRGSAPSGHRSDGSTLLDRTVSFALSLLEDLEAGAVNEEHAYGVTHKRARVYTLAGGGPAAELIVLGDGEDTEAYLGYWEFGGGAVVQIPHYYAERLAEAMEAP